MAYTPTEWQTGDIVTANKLNNMENGIADATTMIIGVSEQGVMDKTWSEVMTALRTGKRVIIINETQDVVNTLNVTAGWLIEGTYTIAAYFSNDTVTLEFLTDSEDGYPTHSGWEP